MSIHIAAGAGQKVSAQYSADGILLQRQTTMLFEIQSRSLAAGAGSPESRGVEYTAARKWLYINYSLLPQPLTDSGQPPSSPTQAPSSPRQHSTPGSFGLLSDSRAFVESSSASPQGLSVTLGAGIKHLDDVYPGEILSAHSET